MAAATKKKKIAVQMGICETACRSICQPTEQITNTDYFLEMVRMFTTQVETVGELYEDLKTIDGLPEILAAAKRDMATLAEMEGRVQSAALRGPSTLMLQRQGAATRALREQIGLRPNTLSSMATPPVMRVWVKMFMAYHAASNMDTIDLTQQHAFFTAHLDAALAGYMDLVVSPSSTISDCVRLLEGRFLEINPLFQRRWQWHKAELQPGQSIRDAITDLQKVGEEAELSKMTTDNWYMFKAIHTSRVHPDMMLELRGGS